MKIRILILISLILFWTGCEKVRHWPWESRIFTLYSGRIEVQTPDLFQTNQGKWLIVFSSQEDPENGEGLILLIRSDHLQGPWSQPDTIARTANLCRFPKITQLENGMIWVQFEIGHILHNHEWNSLGTAYIKSYDYGQRFTIPRMIRVPESRSWRKVQTMIESESGLWTLPILEIDSLKHGIPGFVTSDNEGESWSKLMPVLPDTSGMNILDFSVIILNDQTHLMILEMKGEAQLFKIVSQEMGRNWTAPVPVNIYGTRPSLLQSESGTVYCWYHDLWPPGTDLMRSYDFGRTFEQESKLELPENASFPSIVKLKKGQMGLFYAAPGGIYARVHFTDAIDTPLGLSASTDSECIALRWNPVEEASYYRIFRGLGPDSLNPEIRFYDMCTKTCYQDTMVRSGKIYIYKITAVRGIGRLFPESGSESAPSESCEIFIPARK